MSHVLLFELFSTDASWIIQCFKKVSKQFLKKTLQDLVTNYNGSCKNLYTELFYALEMEWKINRGQIESGVEHLKKDLR